MQFIVKKSYGFCVVEVNYMTSVKTNC